MDAFRHVAGMSLFGMFLAYPVALLFMLPFLSTLVRRGVNLSLTLTLVLAGAVGVLLPLVITGAMALIPPATGWEWTHVLGEWLYIVPGSLTIGFVFWFLSVHQNSFTKAV